MKQRLCATAVCVALASGMAGATGTSPFADVSIVPDTSYVTGSGYINFQLTVPEGSKGLVKSVTWKTAPCNPSQVSFPTTVSARGLFNVPGKCTVTATILPTDPAFHEAVVTKEVTVIPADAFANASIVAVDSFAVAPFDAKMDLKLSDAAQDALKSVTWRPGAPCVASDATYPTLTSVRAVFKEPGACTIIATLTSKDPSAAPIELGKEIIVVPNSDLAIESNTLVAPGVPVPLSAKLLPQPIDGPAKFVWSIQGPSGTTPQTFTTTSERFGGSDVVLNNTVVGNYAVSVGVYGIDEIPGKTAPAKSATSTVTVGLPALTASRISGPTSFYVGDKVLYKAQFREPWRAGTKTDVKLVRKFVLPNGYEIDINPQDINTSFEWITGEGDIGTPGDQYVSTKQYYDIGDGQETGAVLTRYKISLTKYVWPSFVLEPKCDSTFIPMRCSFTLKGASQADVDAAKGKHLSYVWTTPDGAVGAGKNLNGYYELKKLGAYNFSVKVSDDRGNSSDVTYAIDAHEYAPYKAKLTAFPAMRYNRAPMTFALVPKIIGGVRGDPVASYKLFVDGTEVELANPQKAPRILNIPDAGSHAIELKFVSKAGNSGNATTDVVVNENKPATCQPLDLVVDVKHKVLFYATKGCSDPDGKVKTLHWIVDGKDLTVAGLKGAVALNPDKTSMDVELIVTDDAGLNTHYSATANY